MSEDEELPESVAHFHQIQQAKKKVLKTSDVEGEREADEVFKVISESKLEKRRLINDWSQVKKVSIVFEGSRGATLSDLKKALEECLTHIQGWRLPESPTGYSMTYSNKGESKK